MTSRDQRIFNLQLKALARFIIGHFEYDIVANMQMFIPPHLTYQVENYLYKQFITFFHKNKPKKFMVVHNGLFHDIIYRSLEKFDLEEYIFPMTTCNSELKGRKTWKGVSITEKCNLSVKGIVFIPEYHHVHDYNFRKREKLCLCVFQKKFVEVRYPQFIPHVKKC